MSHQYSVIIPAYNCESVINRAVLSALNQTLPPTEIIIVDDASTDTTFILLQQLAHEHSIIKIFQNPENKGVAETRNFAFSKANCKYIALLDADDVWLPEKNQIQLDVLQKKSGILSYTAYSIVDENGRIINQHYSVPEELLFSALLKENFIGCSSIIVSSSVAQKYKMSNKFAHEDYAFVLSILQEYKTAIGVDKPLMIYQFSTDSRSGEKIASAKNRWRIYRDFLNLGIVKSLYYFICYVLHAKKKWANL